MDREIHIQGSMCAPASASIFCRNGLPRRMPCKKNSQVDGTLVPQESRTLRSNQLANEVLTIKSNNFLEKNRSFL
jgi:hypothetical protein